MVFASLLFICAFLPINLILYYIIPNRTYRNSVLIVSSLIFYAWGEPVWVILLVFSSFFDYVNGLIAGKHRGTWVGKAAVASSAAGNLGILCFFKYSGFLVGNISSLFGITWTVPDYHLPIGISFYTFQTLSYVIDVYRGEVEAQRSPFKLLLFVSLFHQLVAGPIVRYKEIAHDIDHRKEKWEDMTIGVRRFIIGLGKKVLLANTAGNLAGGILDGDLTKASVMGAWLGIIFFAFQIYFDFSGYSDMAIGLGRMFGFTYNENFNYPYISKTASEFWRRWHISLGSFFRDYLYIPLGGNRRFQFRNLFVVWFLTGLWHGASWNFVLWGLFYFVLIALEKLFLSGLLKKLPGIVSHIYLLIMMLIGWVFFYFTDFSRLTGQLATMIGLNGHVLYDWQARIVFENNCAFIIIAGIASTPLAANYTRRIAAKMREGGDLKKLSTNFVRSSLYIMLFISAIIFLVGQTYNPFLYFRF